jgi:hypothetical protein
VAGLLLARHGYANDCALVVPMLVFTIQRHSVPRWLKFWALVVLTPAPALMLATFKPFVGQILVVGFVIAALITELTLRDARRPAPGGVLPGAEG